MERFNFDLIEQVESVVVDTYEEAKAHAESGYWVKPVTSKSERVMHSFSAKWRVSDIAQSGNVHYCRRK